MQATHVNLGDPTTYVSGPPHEFFTYLRNEEPVHWHESESFSPGFWVCTKYADVIGVERDVKTYSSAVGGALLVAASLVRAPRVRGDQAHQSATTDRRQPVV